MDSAHGSVPETPIIAFSDWVGVAESPCSSDHTWPPLENASGSLVSFEREIDALNLPFDQVHQTCYQPDTTFNWQSEFNNAFRSPYTLDSLSDDTSYSAYTLNGPLSPVSEGTLVNSPNMDTDSKLFPAEAAVVDYQLASSPSLYLETETEFTFRCQPWSTIPALDACTSIVQMDYDHQDFGRYCLEQPPSRQEIGSASVVVANHTTDVDASTGSFAPTCVAPASPPSSPAELQQDTPKPIPVTRLKRRRNVSNKKKSTGDKGNVPHKRRRPRQDTTKRFACTQPECDSMFARTYNLNVHIRSVHFKERVHRCTAPGCERAFSRKHDLNRHSQSAHTNLGSPRKTPKQDGQAVKGQKHVKEDGLIE